MKFTISKSRLIQWLWRNIAFCLAGLAFRAAKAGGLLPAGDTVRDISPSPKAPSIYGLPKEEAIKAIMADFEDEVKAREILAKAELRVIEDRAAKQRNRVAAKLKYMENVILLTEVHNGRK